jgi:DNA gyrase/topoisomerase IV subunit A
MGERSGVGVVELVILEALDCLGARSDQAEVPNARVLADVEQRIGLAPGYAYKVLIDLVRPWTVPVRLVQGEGDYGEPAGADRASHFRHTESRLSRAGEVVLAAERGELAPVPVGLINGSAYRDGSRPPFHPERVIEAVRQVVRQAQMSDADIVQIVGMPDFLTGCSVSGDLAALAAGQPTVLRLQARVSVVDLADLPADGPTVRVVQGVQARASRVGVHHGILVENLPPNASREDVLKEISDVAGGRQRGSGTRRRDEFVRRIRDIAIISREGDDRFVCVPESGADPETLREALLDFEGITTTVQAALPRPLPELIRGSAHTYPEEDVLTSLASLENAIRDQQAGK